MNEIVSLEKMIQKFVSEKLELEEENSGLENRINNLEKENDVLVSKIKDLEKKLNSVAESGAVKGKTKLDLSERENLKNQIGDLISRIDYHIRS